MTTLGFRDRLSLETRSHLVLSGVALVGLLIVSAHSAQAGVVLVGQSDSYAVSADVTLNPITGLSVHAVIVPQPLATGIAAPPYSNTASLASLIVSAGVIPGGTLVGFQSGLLQETASSNVDLLPGPRTTTAASTINNLNLGAIATLIPGIGITADTLTGSSSVTGDFGSLSATGSLIVTNMSITANGATIFTANGSIAPNTVINLGAGFAGASLLLNEQILSGNGISGLDLIVNAVDLKFLNTSVAGLGALNGQVIIEHSHAQQSAQGQPVPEPASLGLAVSAILLSLGVIRARRKQSAA